MIRRNLILVS